MDRTACDGHPPAVGYRFRTEPGVLIRAHEWTPDLEPKLAVPNGADSKLTVSHFHSDDSELQNLPQGRSVNALAFGHSAAGLYPVLLRLSASCLAPI